MKDILLGDGAVEWQGVAYRTILDTAASGGTMSIVDSVSPPNSGPPRHVHADADETFVLLTGECEFWLEGRSFHRSAGETVFVPRGQEHTFRTIGPDPCRHLVILAPGGFEGFFYEMAQGNYSIPEDMDQIVSIAEKFQLTFTGPPLGAEA